MRTHCDKSGQHSAASPPCLLCGPHRHPGLVLPLLINPYSGQYGDILDVNAPAAFEDDTVQVDVGEVAFYWQRSPTLDVLVNLLVEVGDRACKPGSESSNPAVYGAALRNTYLHEHYHETSDDLALPFNAQGAELFARAALTLRLLVANDDSRPTWKDGDFFGDQFGKIK